VIDPADNLFNLFVSAPLWQRQKQSPQALILDKDLTVSRSLCSGRTVSFFILFVYSSLTTFDNLGCLLIIVLRVAREVTLTLTLTLTLSLFKSTGRNPSPTRLLRNTPAPVTSPCKPVEPPRRTYCHDVTLQRGLED
jgi:hypothetical protein